MQPCTAALQRCAMDPHEPDSRLPLHQTDFTETQGFSCCVPAADAGTTGRREEHSERNLKIGNKINFWGSTACLCHADEKTSSISLLSFLVFVKGINKVVPGKPRGDLFGSRVRGLISCPCREQTVFHGRARHCSDVASYGCNVCSSRSKRCFVSQTAFISDKLCDF